MNYIKPWSELTKKAKILLCGGLGVVGAGAVGVGIWQPWRQAAAPVDPSQANTPSTGTVEPSPKEPSLTLTVGGKPIGCEVYEGDGFSIYQPQGWTVEPDGVTLTQDNGTARITLEKADTAAYNGIFSSLSADADPLRRFYSGGENGSYTLFCSADEADWREADMLMTALARTFTVDGEHPFAGLYPIPQEPDWQREGDDAILFLDKEGMPLWDEAQAGLEAHMLHWPYEKKTAFTGQYQMGGLAWAGCYTGIAEDSYIELFSATASYELSGNGAVPSADWTLKNGWATDPKQLVLAVRHDGSAVQSTTALTQTSPLPLDETTAGELALGLDVKGEELTANERKELEAWFNSKTANGVLRFPLTAEREDFPQALAPYLGVLFYDTGETPSQAEITAFAEIGGITDTDVFKLSRSYLSTALAQLYGLSAKETENMLSAAGEELGIYLPPYDAWFISHGDTMMQNYTFTRAVRYPSGAVRLWYTNPYIVNINGEGQSDVPMTATVQPAENGWQLTENRPVETAPERKEGSR